MGLLAPPTRASAYWRNISSGDIIIVVIESGCMGIIPTGESGGAYDEAPRGESGEAVPMGGESNSSSLDMLLFALTFKGAGAPVLMSLRAGPMSTSSRVSATGPCMSSGSGENI